MKYTRATILKHREKWLQALESGELPQARNVLVKTKQSTGEPIGYCCLGVATMLAKVRYENVKGAAENNYRYGILQFEDPHHDNRCIQSQLLPKDAMEWLGLLNSDPYVAFSTYAHEPGTSLASLNDSGKSFNEIAALIREYGFVSDHDALQQEDKSNERSRKVSVSA